MTFLFLFMYIKLLKYLNNIITKLKPINRLSVKNIHIYKKNVQLILIKYSLI